MACPVSLRRSVYSGSLRGRLHRCAMETCSARIDPHTVFALAPCAISLKNALSRFQYVETDQSAHSQTAQRFETRRKRADAETENGPRQPINPAYPVQCLHDADRLRAPRPLHQRWQSANAELAHEYAPARRRAVRSPSARGL